MSFTVSLSDLQVYTLPVIKFLVLIIAVVVIALAILVLYLYKKLLDLYKWFIKFDDAVAKHLDNICDEVRRQKEIIDKNNQG